MKAILVMEMPENCVVCPLDMDVADIKGKLWKGNICRACGKRNTDRSKKPDWCPLVPMLRKDMHDYLINERMNGYAEGWNACLDAIEGSKG